jgi:PAS domain-containing protein
MGRPASIERAGRAAFRDRQRGDFGVVEPRGSTRRFAARLDPRYSFSARLGLALGLVAFVTSILISLAAGYNSSAQITADSGQFLAEVAFHMSNQLDTSIQERFRDLQVLATLDAIRDPAVPRDAKRDLLERLQNTYTDYSWMGLADSQGHIVVSTRRLLEGNDSSQRKWFVNGQQAPYLGQADQGLLLPNPAPDPTGEPLRFIDLAVPVSDLSGQPAGVLTAHLSWAWGQKIQAGLLEPLQTRQHVEMLVLTHEGTVLLGPPEFKSQAQTLTLDSVAAARAGHNAYKTETWPDGKLYLTGYAGIAGDRTNPRVPWIVLVRQSATAAQAPARALQQEDLIRGILLGILFAVLSGLLAGRLVRPLRGIAGAADRIRQGDAAATIPVHQGHDEVAVLSDSLSGLVSSLNGQKAELSALNAQLERELAERRQAEDDLRRLRDELEVRIQRRTADLVYANQELQTEVAERRRAEAALQWSNALLVAEQEAAIDGILVTDAERRTVSVNGPFCAMWGLAPDTAHKLGPAALVESVLPLLQRPEEFLADLSALYMPEHLKDTRRAEIGLKDGRIIDRYVAPVLSPEGEVWGRIWYFRDVTRQRHATQRLAGQHAVARILAGSSALDAALPQVVQAVLDTLGWDTGVIWMVDPSGAALRSRGLVAHGADAPAVPAATLDALPVAPGAGLPGQVWASGQPAWVADLGEQRATPDAALLADAGLRGAGALPVMQGEAVLGVLEFCSRDPQMPGADLLEMLAAIRRLLAQFTARLTVETELRAAKEAAEAANHARSAALAQISHELRPAIHAIIGDSERLQAAASGGNGPDPVIRDLQRVAASGKQLLALIDDVHNLARQDGKPSPDRPGNELGTHGRG